MKIGCLQFAPEVGDVDKNLTRADAVLEAAIAEQVEDLDILILPEMAFSGYNFRSLRDISPFLEKSCAGVSASWARSAALKYDCTVIVGYPESADVSHKWPCSPEYYNSAIVVNENGDTWGHHRKSHLYYTDETWALEGDGFYKGYLPGLGKMAMGICMDIKFEAPWEDYEFANHILKVSANLVVISMAWLTREPASTFISSPREPDLETLTYWVKRMEPLIKNESNDEVIVIFANRCGIEDEAVYAGTSAVIGIQNGDVTVYGLLGRAESKLLVVDTDNPGIAKLEYRADDGESEPVDEVEDEFPPETSRDTTAQQFDKKYNEKPETFPNERKGGSPTLPGHSMDSFHGQERGRSPATTDLLDEETGHSFEQWYKSTSTHHISSGPQEIIEDDEPPNSEADMQEEFSNLMTTLNKESAVADAEINRPFSTKSRNASRVGHREDRQGEGQAPLRTASRAADRTTHAYRDDLASRTQDHQRVRSASINRLQDGDVLRSKPSISELHQMSQTPELSKVDISDLVIIEEGSGPRTKRDSLLCHVDEDDYVVMRRDHMAKASGSTKIADIIRERGFSGRNTPKSFSSRPRSDSKRSDDAHNHEERSDPRSASRIQQRQHKSEARSTATPPPPLPLNSISKKSSRNHIRCNSTPSSAPILESEKGYTSPPLPTRKTQSPAPRYQQPGTPPISNSNSGGVISKTAPNTPSARRSHGSSHANHRSASSNNNNNHHHSLPLPEKAAAMARSSSTTGTKSPAVGTTNTEIPLIEQLREHRRRVNSESSSLLQSHNKSNPSYLIPTPSYFSPDPTAQQPERRRSAGEKHGSSNRRKASSGERGGGNGNGSSGDRVKDKKERQPPTPKAMMIPEEYHVGDGRPEREQGRVQETSWTGKVF